MLHELVPLPESAMSIFVRWLFWTNCVCSVVAALVFWRWPHLGRPATALQGDEDKSLPGPLQRVAPHHPGSPAELPGRQRDATVPDALPLPAEYQHSGPVMGNVVIQDEAALATLRSQLLPLHPTSDAATLADVPVGQNARVDELRCRLARVPRRLSATAAAVEREKCLEELLCEGGFALLHGTAPSGATEERPEVNFFALVEKTLLRESPDRALGTTRYFLCQPHRVEYGEAAYVTRE